MQFNTTCKDYDSINQHSHQSTPTTGPQGGPRANHYHAQGVKGRSDAGAYIDVILDTIYIHTYIYTYKQYDTDSSI